MLHKM